jgi:hypothetical protein
VDLRTWNIAIHWRALCKHVDIDKKPVEYKEIANSKDARIIQIDLSKNDRTIEIIGTRMAGQ